MGLRYYFNFTGCQDQAQLGTYCLFAQNSIFQIISGSGGGGTGAAPSPPGSSGQSPRYIVLAADLLNMVRNNLLSFKLVIFLTAVVVHRWSRPWHEWLKRNSRTSY